MPGLQEYIFEHLFEPEAGPESECLNAMYFQWAISMFTKNMFKAPKLWILGPQESIFQHILEPEAALRLLPRIQQYHNAPQILVSGGACVQNFIPVPLLV